MRGIKNRFETSHGNGNSTVESQIRSLPPIVVFADLVGIEIKKTRDALIAVVGDVKLRFGLIGVDRVAVDVEVREFARIRSGLELFAEIGNRLYGENPERGIAGSDCQ